MREDKLNALTKSERELVRLLLAGYSLADISDETGRLPQTVKTYKKRLYAKLNVHSRREFFSYFNPQEEKQ